MKTKTIWIVTGLTCSGKSHLVSRLASTTPNPNLINGDILQAYTNFNILVNKDKTIDTIRLYNQFDILNERFTTFEYAK